MTLKAKETQLWNNQMKVITILPDQYFYMVFRYANNIHGVTLRLVQMIRDKNEEADNKHRI